MSNNNLEHFTVYEYNNKIRLGENGDGGYVIANLINPNYDCYISAGVSDEESFSRDFIKKYKMTRYNSYAFDGTIQKYPYNYTKDITFIKKNIGPESNDKIANLDYLIENNNDIFLKMDIEGGEYPWLLNLTLEKLEKFKQIVIEFHGVNNNSWGTNYEDKLICFNKLANTHYLVHIHGNNNSSSTNKIPDVIELTYLRKDLFTICLNLNKTKLPIKDLDFPCKPNSKDYDLCFPPFYNN